MSLPARGEQPLALGALRLVCPKKMKRKTRNVMCNLNSATITKRSTLKKWPTPARIRTTTFQFADI
jgi:hypothetical protein